MSRWVQTSSLYFIKEEMILLNNKIKFNYAFEVPFNKSFKKAYGDFVAEKGKIEEGVTHDLLEEFLLYYVEDLLEAIRKESPEFKGEFNLELRHDMVKGIFKSNTLLPASWEEPLRRKFFERCKTLINRDDLRVDVNLGFTV